MCQKQAVGETMFKLLEPFLEERMIDDDAALTRKFPSAVKGSIGDHMAGATSPSVATFVGEEYRAEAQNERERRGTMIPNQEKITTCSCISH